MSQNFALSRIALAIVLFAGFSCTTVQADVVAQIGEFRIGAADVPADTPYDPGVTFATRSVVGAPLQVNSSFSVGSQNTDGTADANDVMLRTFSSLTRIRNLSRFTPSTVAGSGVERVGMAQWSFNLSAVDTFLAANPTESLQVLDLDLLTDHSDASKATDVYLSYTLPASGIAISSIDSTSGATGTNNWTNFYLPAVGASAGNIVNGTHEVLVSGGVGDLSLNHSLLALYNAGVRDVNLSIAGADFWSGRNIDILAGSGISIETVAVPEPTSLALLGFSGTLLARRRRR